VCRGAAPGEHTGAGTAETKGAAVRVLVVEDDVAMASVLRRGLQENGYAVDVAGNGEDGLWAAAELDHYDAMLLDVALPGIDGLTVLDRLRRTGRWLPVMLLTARDGVPDRVAGLDAGADDYLTKPFAFDELLAAEVPGPPWPGTAPRGAGGGRLGARPGQPAGAAGRGRGGADRPRVRAAGGADAASG
jgi:CheY-like chemotaxis protein